MPHIASTCSGVPSKFAKIVPKKLKAKDDWADDDKSKHPYAGTNGKGDWCPSKSSVEVSVRDESYGADESNGSHREEVRVANQVPHQRGEAAQRS